MIFREEGSAVFYARLEQLCKEAGTSVAAVAEDVLHVSSGAPTGWKKGVSPKASIVAIAARHFGVTADYLLGLTTDMRALDGARALDEGESRLVDALRAAPEPVRRTVLRMASTALDSPLLASEFAAPDSRSLVLTKPAAPAEPSRPRLRSLPRAKDDPNKRPSAWKGVEGKAAAGPPITAVPEDDRRILVPVKYTGEQYFIVQAEGDSMTGLVEDGDYCVFNKRGIFDNGHVALVQVDGPTDQPDATIKRIYRRPGNKVELRSENPKYLPMLYPAEEVVLMGELVAVLPQSAGQP
jgi:SOS-response transcriptional repressor LexA